MMRPSSKCLQLVKGFEGFEAKAYRCPAGKWTIGYGHTDGVKPGDTIDQPGAIALLMRDLQASAQAVQQRIPTPLNQNQLDALTSFFYNTGTLGVTLKQHLRAGDFAAAAAEIERWVHARVPGRHGPVRLPGLVDRRRKERMLFETPVSNENA